MSRSYRKQPFQAICGNGSAKRDKVLAHRGERRTHQRAIHKALQEQDFDVVLVHRLQCSWNNTYSWSRDGGQRYCGLTASDYASYLSACFDPENWAYGDAHYTAWPLKWYIEMMRK